MADYSIEPRNDAVFGMTGSGKTTFVIRLMLNTPAVCRFIFDDENRTAPRLRLKPCYTLRECEEALLTRWVVFNPDRMFAPRDGDRSLFDSKRRAFRLDLRGLQTRPRQQDHLTPRNLEILHRR